MFAISGDCCILTAEADTHLVFLTQPGQVEGADLQPRIRRQHIVEQTHVPDKHIALPYTKNSLFETIL